MFNGKMDNGSFAAKWILSSIVYLILSSFLGSLSQSGNLLVTLLLLVLTLYVVVFRVSLYVRRLRDANKNVWISVISLIPLLDVLLFLMLLFNLNKWAVISITIVTIFFSIIPIIFIGKIVTGENKYKNSTKLNNCYVIYKNEVYYHSYSEFHYFDKLDTTPDQFEALDPVKCYGKDSNHVYFEDEVLEGESPDTFILTEERYQKDDEYWYLRK